MGPPPGLFAELARWRAKAVKRDNGRCTFTSEIIPGWLSDTIETAIKTVGSSDAFLFLKAAPETRAQIERRLRKKLDELLAKYQVQVAAAIARGEPIDYDRMFDELRLAIQPEVAALTTAEALRLSVDTGIVFDPAVINAAAVEWARTYTYGLITGINDTTRNLVQQVERTFFETPGMTQGDLEKMLQHAFGSVRAEMIATTETTRAAAMATNEVQRLVNAEGVPMVRQWHTSNDELVCAICGPLNGRPESAWMHEFHDGPPAHPNCRCAIGLTVVEEAEIEAEARVLAEEREQMLREMGLWKETRPAGAIPELFPEVGQFTDLAQAQRWAETNYSHIQWDFTDTHIDVINPTLAQFDRLAKEYPVVAVRLRSVGTHGGKSSASRSWDRNIHAFATGDGSSIGLNPVYYGDPGAFKRSLEAGTRYIRGASKRWAPEGCDGFEYIITHEFGHQVNNWLTKSISVRGAAFIEHPDIDGFGLVSPTVRVWQEHNKATQSLSVYATTNEREAFAEGFSALHHSSSRARPVFVKRLDILLQTIGPTNRWRWPGNYTYAIGMLEGPDKVAAFEQIRELKERIHY